MSIPASLASSAADLLLNLELHHEQHPLPETLVDKSSVISDRTAGSRISLERLEEVVGTKSKTSVTLIAASHRVPISQRRGPLSFLTVVPEYDDARNYSRITKLIVVSVVAFASITGPMGTSIMLPAVDDMAADLNTTVSTVNISVGIYLISLGIFPMWWSNFSEKHGRRMVYVFSFAFFFAFSIGSALAPSISSLIAMRLLAGVGASAVQACGAATVADLYVTEERGTALGIFYLGPLLGPFLSPIIGGAVAEAWGWRATMWVMVIFCGINVVLIIIFLPETLRKEDSMENVRLRLKEQLEEKNIAMAENELERIATNLSQSSSLRRQILDDETPMDFVTPALLRLTTNRSAYSKRLQEYEMSMADSHILKPRTKWPHILYDYIIRPAHAVVLLGYPPVALAIAFSAFTFMGIYFFNISITNSYSSAPYNFSSVIVGLMYIPNSFTYIIASIYGGKWNDWLIRRCAKLNNGEMIPESRISWNIVVAVSLFPPACLIFGWCMDKGEFWLTPLIGTALFGFASMLVIGVTLTYIIDVLPGKGATGVALNNLVRQILAAIATFVTEPLVRALTIGVLFSIYLGVIMVASLCMLYLKRNGGSLRHKYDITDYYAKL